jgi:hypothetical protein
MTAESGVHWLVDLSLSRECEEREGEEREVFAAVSLRCCRWWDEERGRSEVSVETENPPLLHPLGLQPPPHTERENLMKLCMKSDAQ